MHNLFQQQNPFLFLPLGKRKRVWSQTHTYKNHLSTVELCYLKHDAVSALSVSSVVTSGGIYSCLLIKTIPPGFQGIVGVTISLIRPMYGVWQLMVVQITRESHHLLGNRMKHSTQNFQSMELLEGLKTEQSTYGETFFGTAVVTFVTCHVT